LLPDIQGRKPESQKLLKWLVKLLLQQCLPEYSKNIVTDFGSTILSKVDLETGQGSTYEVQYRAEEEDEPQLGGRIYRIRIQPNGTIQSSELVDDLTSSNTRAICEQKNDVIQALNIIVGHYNKASKSVLFAKPSKYYPFGTPAAETWNLGAGLQALRGYFVSVRATTARILVNI
jgi:eukaryotic translation initiation factor 2C